jgi:hypothetical protein
MTVKTKEKAAQGASTPTTKKESPSEVKPINAVADQARKQEAYFENLTANVKARTLLKHHRKKIAAILQDPDLVSALEDDEHASGEAVTEIVIKTQGQYNTNSYTISNDGLCMQTLKHIDGLLSAKLEEVEINLQNPH